MKTVFIIWSVALLLIVGEIVWFNHEINRLVSFSDKPDVTYGLDRNNPPLNLPLTNLEKQGLK